MGIGKGTEDQRRDQGQSCGEVTFMLKVGKEVTRHRRERRVFQSGQHD